MKPSPRSPRISASACSPGPHECEPGEILEQPVADEHRHRREPALAAVALGHRGGREHLLDRDLEPHPEQVLEDRAPRARGGVRQKPHARREPAELGERLPGPLDRLVADVENAVDVEQNPEPAVAASGHR